MHILFPALSILPEAYTFHVDLMAQGSLSMRYWEEEESPMVMDDPSYCEETARSVHLGSALHRTEE